MHTKTSKQVLSPLADAVSALIIIISDSDINSTPTPDLSQLSKAVESQIQNLIVVAKKITNQPTADLTLKELMPLACQQVSDASNLLVSSTSLLARDPFSSKGRQDLLEAVKGILEGTTRILDVFDDSEMYFTSLLRNLLLGLENFNGDLNNQAQYIQNIKRISQSIFTTCQLCSKRVGDIVSDQLALDLKDAIENIKNESGPYIQACKLFLTWPDARDAKEILTISRKNIENNTIRIDEIVTCKDYDEYAKKQGSEEKSNKYAEIKAKLLGEPLSEQWKKSSADTDQLCKEFMSEALKRNDKANEILEHIAKEEVHNVAKSINEATGKNVDTFKGLLEEQHALFDEKQLDQDSSSLIAAIDKSGDILESNAINGVISEMITTLGNLSDPSNLSTVIGQMQEQVDKTNPELLGEKALVFRDEAKKLDVLVSAALKTVDPTNQTLPIANAQFEKCQKSLPAVIAAVNLYKNHPENALAKDYATKTIGSYADTIKDLTKTLVSQEGVFAAPQLIQAGHVAFSHHSKSLLDAIAKNDLPNASKEMNLTGLSAMQLLRITEQEMENTEDQTYKQALATEIAFIKGALPQLISRANDLFQHLDTSSEVEKEELNKIVKSIVAGLSSVGNVVREYNNISKDAQQLPAVVLYEKAKPQPPEPEPVADPNQLTDEQKQQLIKEAENQQDDHLRALTSAIKELVIVQEEAPKVLSETEAQQNPIKAAGQELVVEASHWAQQENDIVLIVNKIAQKFLDLSEYHNKLSHHNDPQAKRSFIQTAQDIMRETDKLEETVKVLIMWCADKRLCTQIQNTLARLVTLAQTLKVIAAVKASSPKDTDKAVQLVSCGQNVVQSVKMVLRDAISCSLRLKKDCPSDLVRFRKVIYAKGK
ncbi:hypothetical protein HK103_006922 [Boothiomyces macroporosus]|uniref:Vinculin n=1 Tax=Boothiomyces macroporosus TaxID=261099 RepID=A0AAD5UPH4_9FUNG|nr:hypothetical protein HK103_006922 [Boothiomyces macroporosus]